MEVVQGGDHKQARGESTLPVSLFGTGEITKGDAEKYASIGESSTLAGASGGMGRMETIPEEPELHPNVVPVSIDAVLNQPCATGTFPKALEEPGKLEVQNVVANREMAELSSATEQGAQATSLTNPGDEAVVTLNEEKEDHAVDSTHPVGENSAFQDPLNVVDRESLLSNSVSLLEDAEGDKAVADSLVSPSKNTENRIGVQGEQIFGVKQGEDTADKPKLKPIPIVWGSHLNQTQETEKPLQSSPTKLAGPSSLPFGSIVSKPFSFGAQNALSTPKGLDSTSGRALFGGMNTSSGPPVKSDFSYGKTNFFSEQVKQSEHKDAVEIDRSRGVKGYGGDGALFGMPQTSSSFRAQPFGVPSKNGIDQTNSDHPVFSLPQTSPAGWVPSEQKKDLLNSHEEDKRVANQQPISVFSKPDIIQPSPFLGGASTFGNATSEPHCIGQVSSKPLLFGGANMEAFSSRVLNSFQTEEIAAKTNMTQPTPSVASTSQYGGSTAASSVTDNENGGFSLHRGSSLYHIRKPIRQSDANDSENCSPVYAMPPPAAAPTYSDTGFGATTSQGLGNSGRTNTYTNSVPSPGDDECPVEKPTVEVTDSELWEIKFKTKCKLYKNVENAWRQVGIGSLSIRLKKDEEQGKGWLFCTTDSGSVLMCNPLYPEMHALQQQKPKMLLTSGTFLERKVTGAPGDAHPITEETWVPAPALIEVSISSLLLSLV